jgi:ubiquitin carboxyl-terminal hydrolase 4/11/15
MPCDETLLDFATMIKWASTVTLSIDWCSECISACQKFDDTVSSVSLHQTCSLLRAEISRSVSLDDCMRLFSSNEKLGPEDPWYCPQCKDHKQAFKKFDLWRIPQILVVHLKRFQYSRLFREKLLTNVEFPTDVWDISQFVPPQPTPPLYRLYAVSDHMGGLGGGHYVAHARNRDTGKWYLFNDSMCHEVGPQDVRGNSAYVLFYERINQAEPTPLSS